MLKKLKRLFGESRVEAAPGPARALQLAVATLLHESKRVDSVEDPAEHEAAGHALEALFGLEAHEREALLEEGRSRARELTSYYAPVGLIKRAFSLEQRVDLVEHLWRVAYANGRLDLDEDHFVRKIAHLLHVPNTECMLARSRARARH